MSRRSAVVLLEAAVSIMLIGMVLGAVSLLMVRYATSVDYFLNYRRSQLAAESCIERIRGGDLPAVTAVVHGPSGAVCEITMENGKDVWTGLLHVRVTASVTGKHGRVARYRLVTYLAPKDKSKDGGP